MQHLIHRRTPMRYLAQTFVYQIIHSYLMKAVKIAPERSVTHLKQPCRIFLRQPPIQPF
jgi:hypothetical protein